MSSQPEILNAHRHRHLKLRGQGGYAFARHIAQVDVMLSEFRLAASVFPIVFMQEADAPYPLPVALLQGTDSIRADGTWRAHYLPLMLRVYPFALAGSRSSESPRVCIDLASPHLSEMEGVPLFLADGQPAPALNDIMQGMADLHRYQTRTGEFCRVLNSLGLFVPVSSRLDQEGIYRVSEARLDELTPAAVKLLRKRNWFAAIYAHLVSLAAMEGGSGAVFLGDEP